MLKRSPKSCTRKEHESATNSIAKRGQGAVAPCRVKGQRPLWGLGQRPNCSASDHHLKCTQQRRRQRSVPASNFARPQTRPQAALPPRFREKPEKSPLTFLAPAGCNTGIRNLFWQSKPFAPSWRFSGLASRMPLIPSYIAERNGQSECPQFAEFRRRKASAAAEAENAHSPRGRWIAHASPSCLTNATGSTNWKRAFCMALRGKSTRLMGCSFCVAVTMTCVTGSVANKSRAIRSDKPHK